MLLLEQHEVDGSVEIKDLKLEALGEVFMAKYIVELLKAYPINTPFLLRALHISIFSPRFPYPIV